MSCCRYNRPDCRGKWICLCLPPYPDKYKPIAFVMGLAIHNSIDFSGKIFDEVIQNLMALNSEHVELQLFKVGIEKGKHYTITPDGCLTEIIDGDL